MTVGAPSPGRSGLSTTLESWANATLENEATSSCCLVCLVLGSDAGKAVDASSAESVAGAFEGEDVGVVDDAVDHGCGDGLVAEDASTAGERQVAGEHQGCVFVA